MCQCCRNVIRRLERKIRCRQRVTNHRPGPAVKTATIPTQQTENPEGIVVRRISRAPIQRLTLPGILKPRAATSPCPQLIGRTLPAALLRDLIVNGPEIKKAASLATPREIQPCRLILSGPINPPRIPWHRNPEPPLIPRALLITLHRPKNRTASCPLKKKAHQGGMVPPIRLIKKRCPEGQLQTQSQFPCLTPTDAGMDGTRIVIQTPRNRPRVTGPLLNPSPARRLLSPARKHSP